MDLGAAEVLNALCAELTAQGTSSRELTALEFDPASGHVEIVSRKRPHAKGYPDLVSTLKNIGQTCAKDRIGVQQLRRIDFLEQEIKLELVSRSGAQTIVYSYPIED
jgi:hypothetical protein